MMLPSRAKSAALTLPDDVAHSTRASPSNPAVTICWSRRTTVDRHDRETTASTIGRVDDELSVRRRRRSEGARRRDGMRVARADDPALHRTRAIRGHEHAVVVDDTRVDVLPLAL